MTELTVKFPDELAQQIRAVGLLDVATLEKVFRDALRKQAFGELFAALDEMQALKLPPDRRPDSGRDRRFTRRAVRQSDALFVAAHAKGDPAHPAVFRDPPVRVRLTLRLAS